MYKREFTRAELTTSSRIMGVPTGRCSLCYKRGEFGNIPHTEDCPLASDLVLSVTVSVRLDPAKICTKCKGDGKVRWTIQDESEIITCDRCKGSGLKPEPTGDLAIEWRQNRFWWTAPSGKEYHVELLPNRVEMFDAAGNSMLVRKHLDAIWNHLLLHEGRF